MKNIFLTLLVMFSAAATAEYQIRDAGEVQSFGPTDPNSLSGHVMDYSFHAVDFENWSGLERKVLNLFDGFKVLAEKPTRMFIVKVAFLVDRNADNVNVKQLLNLDTLQSLDKMVVLTKIDPKSEKIITETDASSAYRNPPAPYHWCDESKGALCFSSNFKIQKPYNFAAAIMLGTNPFRVIEGQSELRVTSGPEIANAADLTKLIGINAAPSSVIVQNMFWANRLIRFGKMVGVLQPVGNQTLVTAYMAFAIDRKLWDLKVDVLQNGNPIAAKPILYGESPITQNDGILAGIPKFTKNMAKSLAELLNK